MQLLMPVLDCPPWCDEHELGDDGELVHYGAGGEAAGVTLELECWSWPDRDGRDQELVLRQGSAQVTLPADPAAIAELCAQLTAAAARLGS